MLRLIRSPIFLCFVIFSSAALGMDETPKEVKNDEGVRWVSYVPPHIENHFIEMAKVEKEARSCFLKATPDERTKKEDSPSSVNLVSMKVLCYGTDGVGPLSVIPLQTDKGIGKTPIFCASNDHSFTQFKNHNLNTSNPGVVIGLETPNSADEVGTFKNLLSSYEENLKLAWAKLAGKFWDPTAPQSSQPVGVEQTFRTLEEAFGNMVADVMATKRDEELETLKEKIKGGVNVRLESNPHPPYEVVRQNVSPGVLEKAFNQPSHSLDSEQYLLYRLTTPVNDGRDADIYIPDVFKDFNVIEKIQKVILLVHSTYDMCSKCSVSMARDYAGLSGATNQLSDMVEEHNQAVNYIFKTNGGIKAQINIIVASSREYQEHGGSLRRYLNYRTEDDCDKEDTFIRKLKEFWERRLIIQWRIPTYKLDPMALKKTEETDSSGYEHLNLDFFAE